METRFLSKGGRLTFVKTVLSGLPVYFLSLFQAPKTVLHILEKKRKNFIWSKADGSLWNALGGKRTVHQAKRVCWTQHQQFVSNECCFTLQMAGRIFE